MLSNVIFWIAALGALSGAIGVVALRNPFYSVLSLVFHLLSLAALFLLLRAQFIAAAQVVVYAGAVMVLYVFVVAYVGANQQEIPSPGSALRVAGPLFAGALLVELCIATIGSGLAALDGPGAPTHAGFGGTAAIGRLLLTKFLLPFEVASFLLLIAAVGAVLLARRRRGLGEEEAGPRPAAHGASAAEVARRARTGTMREGVGAGSGTTEGGW